MAQMDYKMLSREKKFVKDELKNYDTEFKKLFNREPSRDEKEPMRPLYVYYKRLKQYLSKVEKEGGGSGKAGSKESTTTSSIDAN
mmetsp:Transcript_40359/g.35833  ORF Transcript_40359/g.35833 Transcript_40359/m.35833 type:complete len:85 (+) Transcript_40359:555-809(+)